MAGEASVGGGAAASGAERQPTTSVGGAKGDVPSASGGSLQQTVGAVSVGRGAEASGADGQNTMSVGGAKGGVPLAASGGSLQRTAGVKSVGGGVAASQVPRVPRAQLRTMVTFPSGYDILFGQCCFHGDGSSLGL